MLAMEAVVHSLQSSLGASRRRSVILTGHRRALQDEVVALRRTIARFEEENRLQRQENRLLRRNLRTNCNAFDKLERRWSSAYGLVPLKS